MGVVCGSLSSSTCCFISVPSAPKFHEGSITPAAAAVQVGAGRQPKQSRHAPRCGCGITAPTRGLQGRARRLVKHCLASAQGGSPATTSHRGSKPPRRPEPAVLGAPMGLRCATDTMFLKVS